MSAQEQKQKFQRIFVNPQHEDVVNFTMKRLHDYWVITSNELPGLFLCSKEIGKAIDQIGPAIEGLWEIIQNPEKYKNVDVPQALPPQTPAPQADTPECNHDFWVYTPGVLEEPARYGKRCIKCQEWQAQADTEKEAAQVSENNTTRPFNQTT